MASAGGEKGGGFVKGLLFPAYTDAGANDTFKGDENVPASSSLDEQSEATTAIADNRTRLGAHQQKDDDTAALGEVSAPQTSSAHGPLQRESNSSVEALPRTRFFPSTAPRVPLKEGDRSLSVATQLGAQSPITGIQSIPSTSSDSLTLDRSSMTAISGASTLVGQSFVSDAQEAAAKTPIDVNHATELDDEPDETPIKNNRTVLTADNLAAKDAASSPFENNKLGGGDGASSTCSEMGTVVNMSSKLAEVNAMAMMSTPPAGTTPIQEEVDYSDGSSGPLQERDVESLSLPRLGANLSRDSKSPTLSLKENKEETASQTQSPGGSSAAAMVSAAFRRISGNRSGAFSAPSTPRTSSNMEDFLRKSQQSGKDPTTLLLRSPGASVHYPRQNPPALSPRYSTTVTSSSSIIRPSQQHQSEQSTVLRHANSLASPLRFARGCLSFDSTSDGDSYSKRGFNPISSIPEQRSRSMSRPTVLHSQSWDVGSFSPRSSRSAFRSVDGPGLGTLNSQQKAINHSLSVQNNAHAMPLRTPQRIEIEREDALDILSCLVERSVAFENETLSTVDDDTGEEVAKLEVAHEASTEVVIDDDKVSTFAAVGGQEEPELLSPPKRKKMLKATAEVMRSDPVEMAGAIKSLREISKTRRKEDNESSAEHAKRMQVLDELLLSYTYAGEMKRATKSASAWLRSIGRSESSGAIEGPSLVQQDSFLPPSVAVGSMSQSAGEEQESEADASQFVDKMDILGLNAMVHSAELKVKDKEEQIARLNEELSTCRAEIGRMKSASSRTTEILFSPNRSVLDNDDSDSSEGASDVEALGGFFNDTSPIRRTNTYTAGDMSFGSSFFETGIGDRRQQQQDWSTVVEAKKESIMLKAALSQANETIRKLHTQSSDGDTEQEAPVVTVANPELSKELDEYKQALERAHSVQASGSDQQTINVRMLDGENFVTEWNSLKGLPPPPDHDLHSPIVAALLQQWTTDLSMHESLLSWMERVMNGADPSTIPPLTISSLDHQVRDGLAMHVLPLLLKRSDIHVDVKTRAHCRTTYDMSVTVQPSTQIGLTDETPLQERATRTHLMAFRATRGDDVAANESMLVNPGSFTSYFRKPSGASSDLGTGSVAHSSVTEQISNASKFRMVESKIPMPRQSGGASISGDDMSTGSSRTGSSSQKSVPQQPGLITSFGNTVGGLLSRRAPKHSSQLSLSSQEDEMPHETAPPYFRQQPPPSPRGAEGGDEQPYHRVVSAPPGRIGVTFVQYRGHAMVSDVAPESPLSGWVFPSDILIAIDEIPVSGMRVREIVKLLTARKERQRALRVISSHAMNEFTMNTSTAGSDVVT